MTIVDVRILVEGASDVEVVSKALQGLALGSEYNITISSIIPTTNIEIAKSAAAGADLLIIATDADRVGRDLAERLYAELSEMVGHVERMKLPLGHDLEHVDVELVRKELKNTLVRAGLKSLQILPEYMGMRNQLLDLKGRYEGLLRDHEELEKAYRELERNHGELKNQNEQLLAENRELRKLLEERDHIYRTEEVWKSLFPAEEMPDEEYIGKAVEKLGLGGKVIIGQGYIYAESRKLVEDLLKTVYLSLAIGQERAEVQKEEVQEENADEEEDIEKLLRGL